MRKITGRYFDKDYWTTGKKSGYKANEYTIHDYMNEAKADFLVKLYGDTGIWLEAGCAFGWTVEQLMVHDQHCYVYGFDISKYAIKNAPETICSGLQCSDGLNPKIYAPGFYDIIYSFETAEHVAEQDVQQWIDNLYYWLKPGGKLFMTICLGHNNIRGLDDNDESHQTLQTRIWWEDRIRDAGFIIDEESYSKAQVIEVATEEMLERGTPEILMPHYGLHVFAWEKP